MTPIYKIEIEGNDITAKIKPYFVSLTIDDKEGEESDSFELVLADDGSVDLPPKGKKITVWIGYKDGVTAEYGPYIIDYAKKSGPPDRITLMAHGADLRDQMKAKKTRHFDDITLGDLVATIASEYNLQPYVSEEYADIVIPYLPQDNISDFILLNKLAMQYGARIKPETGSLTFTPKGITFTSDKQKVEIQKTQCTRYQIHLPDRYRYGSVKARWYDIDAAQYKSVTVGDAEPVQVLSDVYSSEPEAYHAAKAEMRLIKKIQGKFFMTMPIVPSIRNETPARLKGFKQIINDTPWVISNAKHTISAAGATTTVEGEIQPLD